MPLPASRFSKRAKSAVCIPDLANEGVVVAPEDSYCQHEPGGRVQQRPLNVLVVEDDDTNATLVKIILERAGCSVRRAADAEEVFAEIDSCHFDIVFMDYRLPGMAGVDITRILRQREESSNAPLRIVGVTASAFAEDRAACLAAGMDDLVIKPYRLDTINQCLVDFAAKRRSLRTDI